MLPFHGIEVDHILKITIFFSLNISYIFFNELDLQILEPLILL